MPQAHFKISNGSDGQCTFNLIADQGREDPHQRALHHARVCEGGVTAVRTNAVIDSRCDWRRSKDDQHYFVLQAGNDEVIGTSETYTSTSARENGIASVKSTAVGVNGLAGFDFEIKVIARVGHA